MSNGHLHQEEWRHWLLVSALSGQLWVLRADRLIE